MLQIAPSLPAGPAAPYDPLFGRNRPPTVDDTVAAVMQAGRVITELSTRLAEAERTIATLKSEKRALVAELRATARGLPRQRPDTMPAASHLDGALAALAEGLGPALVRPATRR